MKRRELIEKVKEALREGLSTEVVALMAGMRHKTVYKIAVDIAEKENYIKDELDGIIWLVKFKA